MGSLWRHNQLAAFNILKTFPNNKVVIFPQTIYYTQDDEGKKEFLEDQQVYSILKRLIICLRDERSFNYAVASGLFSRDVKILFTPDMVLSLNIDELNICLKSQEINVLCCLRDDQEAALSEEKRTEIIDYCTRIFGTCEQFSTNDPSCPIPLSGRKVALELLFSKLKSARIIITDRLHCMIFAYLLDKPCIVYDNVSNKVKGVFQWIKSSENIIMINHDDDYKSILKTIQSSNHSSKKTFNMKEIIEVLKEES